jgi:hypothetical protein
VYPRTPISTPARAGKDDAVLVDIEVRISAAPFEYPVRSGQLRLKSQNVQSVEASGSIGFSKFYEENRLRFAMIDFKVKLVFSLVFMRNCKFASRLSTHPCPMWRKK